MTVAAPEPLSDRRRLDDFDCGIASLDAWLVRRALRNQVAGASRTFVACESDKIAGFYALASGSIATNAAPGRFRRNMPEPIPVAVLGRLAVDRTYQGRGLGRALFRDAAKRLLNAADTLGIRGIVVHAISDDARRFYVELGLESSPLDPMTLTIPLSDLREALSS